jgi:RNA polymerase sigma-70 factor (ECF subfamily)
MPTLPRAAAKSSPPAGAEDLLRKAVVTEALRALPPAHREVLNETILRGRTVNDAATALGIPVGTVKSRVYYALHALRAALAERGTPAVGAAGCP